MPKRTVWTKCKVCGKNARLVKYYSKGHTGKIYRYSKFVHPNLATHYYRLSSDDETERDQIVQDTTSNFDLFEEMILTRMSYRSYRFTELKRLFEEVKNKSVSNTTIYRVIKRFLKQGLIETKRENHITMYSRAEETVSRQEFVIKKMAIGYVANGDHYKATLFVTVESLGKVLLNKIPIALPIGAITSLESVNFQVYDESGSIPQEDIEINYSYYGQTGISIPLNHPLKTNEERTLFISYDYKMETTPFRIFVQDDISLATINIETETTNQVAIKKEYMDGLRQYEPPIQRTRSKNDSRVSVESQLESLRKGEIIIVSINKKRP